MTTYSDIIFDINVKIILNEDFFMFIICWTINHSLDTLIWNMTGYFTRQLVF